MFSSCLQGSRDRRCVRSGVALPATLRGIFAGQIPVVRSALVACLLSAALMTVAIAEGSASGLRCGAYLISLGDSATKVLDRCGPPSNVEAWEEEFIKRDFYRPYTNDLTLPEMYREPFFVKEKRKIEEWEYNFGPTRFIYYIRFENGKVRRITTGEYGY